MSFFSDRLIYTNRAWLTTLQADVIKTYPLLGSFWCIKARKKAQF